MNVPQSPRLAVALGLALLAGCDQPTGDTRPRSTAPVVAQPEAPTPPPAPAPEVKSREILGQRTQDVRDAAKEAEAGGVETAPRITAKDPILLVGNAYVSIIGRSAQLNIEHAIDLYKAENGDYPKTFEEFMDKIIKANNIALPKLPEYQDYAYKAEEHKLVIMEYPDRKAKMNYPK